MNEFFLTLLLMGALSTGGPLPFWMTSNQFGLMPETSGALALARMGTVYDPSKTVQWRWGASLAANYGGSSATPVILSEAKDLSAKDLRPMVDELYASLKWKVFSVDLGMRRFGLDYYGAGTNTLGSMSTTGGHIIWSGNARTLPGYTVNLDPVVVPFTGGRVKLSGSYGDYKTMDNRYMKDALIHSTRIGLDIKITDRLDFHGMLDHYAIWGGKSEKLSMPVTFGNYCRVVMGKGASSEGTLNDQLNVIGDQGGGELFRFNWRGNGWMISAQHDIPYNDGSGMGFQNFPDGVNTIWLGFDDKDRWVTDILYEYQYTMFQSGTRHDRPTTDEEKAHLDPSDEFHYYRHIVGGGDNYFNNGEYKSGWTYYGHTIGNPLFVPKSTHAGTWTGRNTVLGVENNRLKAHHFSIAGKLFRKAPYKLMLTYSHNYGTYGIPYKGESQWLKDWGTVKETPLNQVSGAFVGEIPGLLEHFTLTYGLYADRGELLPDNFGATLGIRYSL